MRVAREPGRSVDRGRGLRAAAGRLLRLAVGQTPWPRAGGVGHVAAMILVVGALFVVVATLQPAWAGTLPSRHFGGIGNSADDYAAYATGAAILARGEAPRLYDIGLQTLVQRELLGSIGAPLDAPNTFVNPPLMAALFLPFIWSGVPAGSVAWRLATLVLAIGVVVWTAREAAPPEQRWRRGALLTLCCMAFVQAWQLGSMIGLQLLAFAGWLAWGRSGRTFLAGMALSVLLLKPQYLPFPLLYLVWKRQWRQLAGCASGAALHLGATLVLLPFFGGLPSLTPLLSFATLDPAESRVWVETVANHVSVRGLLRLVLPEVSTLAELALTGIATVIFSAWVLRSLGRRWPTSQGAFWWESLGVAAATALTAFHNHVSGLVFLLPAAAVLLSRGVETRTVSSPRWSPEALLALLLALPTLGILAVAAWFPLYIASAWVFAGGSLLLGLRETAREGWDRAPSEP